MNNQHVASQNLKETKRVRRLDASVADESLPLTEVIETESAELDDGILIEMIEDPENSSKTVFAVWKNGEVSFADRYHHGHLVFVPIPRNQNLIRHVKLPRGVKDYRSTKDLLLAMDSFIERCLDIDKVTRIILSCFVLSTWVIDQLPIAPYFALVGLPHSGKSTSLRVMSLLCRRSLLTADLTSAAFYRLCDRITPTLFIDETNTAGSRRNLFHLLRTGTTRDVITLRKDESFSAFGAKGISWTELPNDIALNTRCLLIPLQETRRTDLKRPSSPEVLQAADDLQMQLQQFRFANHKRLTLPVVAEAEQLHARTRDLYEALALPCAAETDLCRGLAVTIKTRQDVFRRELSVVDSGLLQELFEFAHLSSGLQGCTVKYLTTSVNSNLEKAAEKIAVSARAIGAVLTSMGFPVRNRTNQGYWLDFDRRTRQHIHNLAKEHGIDIGQYLKCCEFCKISWTQPDPKIPGWS